MAPIVRTMEAYSIHGHINPGSAEEELVAYTSFFEKLMGADPHSLRFAVGSDTVAIADRVLIDHAMALRFVTGNAEELPLVYDSTTGQVEEVDPGSNRLVVSGAWAIVAPERRILVLERRRPGVPVFQIERFLTQFGRRRLGVGDISLSLNPIPSDSFTEEVKRFTRIREASLTMRRPNQSWTASAEAMLGELAESNAAEVQLQLNADRGQSLSKDRGIVAELLHLASRPINALKNAVVRGQTPSFEGERTVSLAKHTVKGTARIDPSAPPVEQLVPLSELANAMIERIPAVEEVLESQGARELGASQS